MLNPGSITRFLAWAGGVATFIVALMAWLNPEGIWKDAPQAIFSERINISRAALFLLLVIPPSVVFYFWNLTLFQERAKHKYTRQRLAATEDQRIDLDRLRFTDVVTRIPNQRQWRKDLQSIQLELERGWPFQVILIDLDNFKAINDRFGFEKGDDVISLFAQTLCNSMRRDEKIYKRPFDELSGDEDEGLSGAGDPEELKRLKELWRRIYRKYSGGDEFLFLTKGTEEEALGFLRRIHINTVTKVSKEVEKLLGARATIDFHGAICPIYPNDDASTAL